MLEFLTEADPVKKSIYQCCWRSAQMRFMEHITL